MIQAPPPQPKRTKTLAGFIAVLIAAATAYLFGGDISAPLPAPQALFSESTTQGVPPARADQPATIARTFNIDDWMVKAGGVVRTDSFGNLSTGETAFRTFCEAGKIAYDDPILYPGQPGVSHLHQFYGNPSVDANSTWASLVTAANNPALHNDFTCAGGPVNGSAYWHPTVIKDWDGDPETTTGDKVVKPEYAIVYYKGFATVRGITVGFPRGFSMIFGVNPNNGLDPDHGFKGWSCGSGTLYNSLADANGNARFTCGTDQMLRLYFVAPRCWNGTQLATANGRDHVKDLLQNGTCPATHPYRIPKFELIVWFAHNGPDDYKNWYFSSDRMPGYPRYNNGASGHTDWMGGWQDDIFQLWQNRCIGLSGEDNDQRSCTDSQIGDGRKMLQTGIITLNWNSSSHLNHFADLPDDPNPEVDPVVGHKSGTRVRRMMHRH